MRSLPLRPLPMPSEALSDFLKRLAHANGYQQWELWHVLSNGTGSHVEILTAALNGYPLPRFSGPAVRGVHIPVEEYSLRSSDFTRMWQRWCPLCIDEAAWLRPEWRIKVATVCHQHAVHLLQTCPSCEKTPEFGDIFTGKCECGIYFSHVVRPAERRHVHVAAAIASSLNGRGTLELGGNQVSLTTNELVRLISYTGRFMDGPDLRKPGQIHQLERLQVASKLFDGAATILSDWPHAYWKCFELCVNNSPHDPSVQRVFGALYRVTYHHLREDAFQFLRDGFESYLAHRWHGELNRRHSLFKMETVQNHPRGSLASTARVYRVGRNTLKRAVFMGQLPATQFNASSRRDSVTLNLPTVRKVIPDKTEHLDLRKASRTFGLKRTRVQQLVAAGVITPEKRPVWMKSDHWMFRRVDVEKFMLELRSKSKNLQATGDVITLNHALRYWRLTEHEFCSLVETVCKNGIPFFISARGLLKDIEFYKPQLHSWLQNARDKGDQYVSGQAAAKLLNVKLEVLYELVDKGLIEATLTSKGGKVFKQISREILKRFHSEFISLAAMARERKTSSNALLKKIHATAVCGPKVDGSRQYFFRRGDVYRSE